MNRPKEFLAWAAHTFGPVALDPNERLARFVEEAIELAHAEAMPAMTIVKIIERVYDRAPGKTTREIGQAQVCLETFAASLGFSAEAEAAREFKRVQSIPADEWAQRHAAKVALGIASN